MSSVVIGRNDPLNLFNSFFFSNGSRIALERVGLYAKSAFVREFYSFEIFPLHENNVNFLRNKASHRNQLTEAEAARANQIISQFDKQYSNYYKHLDQVANKLDALR